jgi:hypothetical protein
MIQTRINVPIAKLNEDRNQVFGFASVAVSKDGKPIEDLQGDIIDPADLEAMAYAFVKDYRASGVQHDADENFVGVNGTLIASVVLMPDIVEAMGFAKDATTPRWFLGFEVAPDVFAKVKKGDLTMFSIQGTATRETV